MARRPFVPAVLRHGPFTVAQAEAAGVSARSLGGSAWRRVEQGVYIWAGLQLTPYERLLAISWRLPPGAVFSGRAAAWLHGIDTVVGDRAEVTLPEAAGVAALAGVRVHRSEVADDERTVRRGLPTTTVPRTIGDLAARAGLSEALVVADAALHAGLTTEADLAEWLASRAWRKGVAAARRVVELANGGAESPMETRLRLLLVTAGLPPPEVQAELRDARGEFIARVDIYYPDARLAIEYDGGVHRGAMLADDRRQNQLIAAGYRILRFNAADLHDRPGEVVRSVRAMLNGRFVDDRKELRAG